MTSMNTDRFQGMCLVNSEGWKHINTYDGFPLDIRLRLQSSAYNLCAACIYARSSGDSSSHLHTTIDQMEAILRQQEGDIYG